MAILNACVFIFSAFSPLKSVEQCKKLTEDFIKGEEVKTIGSQINKAEAIFKESSQTEIAKILNGAKTVAFFHSILGCADSSEIAIDVHMMKLAPSRWGSLTPKRYQMLCQQIQAACRGTYYSPQKYQAGLWGTLKNMSCIEEI